jgi:hypothetical protein
MVRTYTVQPKYRYNGIGTPGADRVLLYPYTGTSCPLDTRIASEWKYLVETDSARLIVHVTILYLHTRIIADLYNSVRLIPIDRGFLAV